MIYHYTITWCENNFLKFCQLNFPHKFNCLIRDRLLQKYFFYLIDDGATTNVRSKVFKGNLKNLYLKLGLQII